ncbi:VanZ family protein [Chengkuizengella axinellae]|uniref:VanZ family protein n=1 Tax=Chengkuizengella axinellae TaxID=3064388 RepID=A0ABT9J007_9BACL|nr:VanZ family protein [Chengkuizengella sp. 2205SS18-9]MDP5274727.1 VanZ family protein [Chengkuizengella sp. 2205SS18-9]
MSNKRKQLKFITSLAVVFLWMLLIFYLSSQVASQSDNLSRNVSEVVIVTVDNITPKHDININTMNHFVRKNAHFFTYLVLGLLVIIAIRRSDMIGFKSYTLAFAICILYAISDEFHQLYVPGRGPEVRDVLIDSLGSLVGISMYYLLTLFGIQKQKKF